jgi:hypothetical protein
MHNLIGLNGTALGGNRTILGYPILKVASRLDSLLLVLKTCKGVTCVRPWDALHADGSVETLLDALSSTFDAFYEDEQPKVSFSRCELGQIRSAEGPQFEDSGKIFERDGLPWHAWV